MVIFGPRSPRVARNKDRKHLGRRKPRAWVLAGASMVAGVLGAFGASGCSLITDSFLTNDFSGDPFPVNVDTTTGAILVGLRQDGAEDRVAVLDVLSPITVVDQDPKLDPSLSYVDLTLLGAASPGGPFDRLTAIPRARFPEAQLVALHPCACAPDDPSCDPSQCYVGAAAAPQPFQAIIGADALAGDDIRLRLADDQIFVLPDVGGNDRSRTLDCDAVFDSPYRGGGTLVFPTTELAFGNRRITLQACLGQDPDPGPLPMLQEIHQHGTDALFVVSTSIGLSILGRAAYERYLLAVADNPPNPPPLPFEQLPPGSAYLPSGKVFDGRLASIDRMALVATSISNGLSPCRQIYAHEMLADGPLAVSAETPDDNRSCDVITTPTGATGATGGGCPCKDTSKFCPVPAILELSPPSGIDVLVVPDTDPTLQYLRAELRPDQPEVDGILGTQVLRGTEIDVDYPHDRLLARCAGADCLVRPQLAQEGDRCQINRCMRDGPPPLGCPGFTPP